MDLSETIEPRSDQQNFDDYIAGPRTVTISAVTKGTAEQPVNIELREYPGRPYKPNKSMRRVLVLAWGVDSSAYVGRRLKLRGNPDVLWGGKPVGGIEIEAMSHIDTPLKASLTVKRGSRAPYVVQPLPADTTANELADVLEKAYAATTKAELRPLYQKAVSLGATEQDLADLQGHAATLPAEGDR